MFHLDELNIQTQPASSYVSDYVTLLSESELMDPELVPTLKLISERERGSLSHTEAVDLVWLVKVSQFMKQQGHFNFNIR